MINNAEGLPIADGAEAPPNPDPNAALRFEDLTIDDDLSLLDRVIRYVRSGIALQRLVHVKMLAEAARSVGSLQTIRSLVPLLPSLVSDSESIIRQHLASQILPLSMSCMFDCQEFPSPFLKEGERRQYDKKGYKTVTSSIVNHLATLIEDNDVDVRKSASDTLATLALYIKKEDIVPVILRIPLKLAQEQKQRQGNNLVNKQEKGAESRSEDLRITSLNLLADISSLQSSHIATEMVAECITPYVLQLCRDQSFRVRRASVQAIPRIVSGSSPGDAMKRLLPAFVNLSDDEMYRVRKSVGECLVDMSRSMMLLTKKAGQNASKSPRTNNNNSFSGLVPFDEDEEVELKFNQSNSRELKRLLLDKRRKSLIGIAVKLLKDSNKFVRHGMMQFLGPFIASFYPLEGREDQNVAGIVAMLSDDEGDNKFNPNLSGGLGVQFFPHVNGMVSRLNPANLNDSNITGFKTPPPQDETDMKCSVPAHLEKSYSDSVSIFRILRHRELNPPSSEDIEAVKRFLLKPFVDLATINSGDDNIDAEMRVYCAYSLPAVILLLSIEGWELSLRNCFISLITGEQYGRNYEVIRTSSVPLPVKRCLASSFHTVCQIIGPKGVIGSKYDSENQRDLMSVFQQYFLKDSDDTVRLNIIRNLPSILAILPPDVRDEFLPVLIRILSGDSMLGAVKRSASNPTMLNWRQRDTIAQIFPFLIVLYKPQQVKHYLWPLITLLMSDSVSLVRENIEWAIPLLFRKFEERNIAKEEAGTSVSGASTFSAEACGAILEHLQSTMLESDIADVNVNKTNRSSSAFSKRQEYCRVCSTVALALNVGRDDRKNRKRNRSVSHEDLPGQLFHPYLNLSSTEYRHIHHILKNYLLPEAIKMKDDRVTNVRLTLTKCLQVMPPDIKDHGEVKKVLRTLEDEIHTWEGGGGMYMSGNENSTDAGNATSNTNAASTSDPKELLTEQTSDSIEVGISEDDNLFTHVQFEKSNFSKNKTYTGTATANKSERMNNFENTKNNEKPGVVQKRVANYEGRRSGNTELSAPQSMVNFD